MAQFDIYRVKGGNLVVDCQSDLLDELPTRFVAPLQRDHPIHLKRLTPVFVFEGESLTMLTPLVGGIALRDIEETVGSLAQHEYAIRGAIDMLSSGI